MTGTTNPKLVPAGRWYYRDRCYDFKRLKYPRGFQRRAGLRPVFNLPWAMS